MLIDDRAVPSRVMALRLAGSGQEGFVHLIAQDQQSGQPMRPLWSRLVAPRVFDLADQLHGSGLLRVVGGAARIGPQVQAWEVETCPTEIQRGEGSSACSRRTNASRWRASKSLRPRCSTTRWRTLSPWVYRFTFPYLWLADRMDVKAVRPRATARPSHEACNQPPQYIRNPLVSRRFVDKSGAVFVLRPERTQRT